MFLIAGFDTTASATVCFAYRLAMHSGIQQRLVEEIDANITDDVRYLFRKALLPYPTSERRHI
jgi:cytochrome P450